jgi:hypothetical protein
MAAKTYKGKSMAKDKIAICGDAIAASIGRKKYGAKEFAHMAAAGRKRAARKGCK